MEADRSKQHDSRRQHGHAPKDGRSRIHRMIRDRIVGSKWFGRCVMFVIILNSILLWPWTDAAKQTGRVQLEDAYPIVNYFFIIVYLTEFILKVCQTHCMSSLIIDASYHFGLEYTPTPDD